MLTFLLVIFYLGVAAGVIALLSFLSGRFFQVDTEPDAIVYCTTEDSWRLALSRYRPRQPLQGAPPVVICPGFGLSSAVVDLDEEVSLVHYLTSHGHDVWVLDLRGRGQSEKSRLWGRRRLRWCFDDYVDFDVPAALEEVCRVSGAEQVSWIGASLGALVLLGADPKLVNRRVRCLAALAAPTTFKRMREQLTPWALRLVRLAWNRHTVRLLAPLLGRAAVPPFGGLYNPHNVDRAICRRALINGIDRFSGPELEQYRSWIEGDAFEALDQQRDYRKQAASLRLPTLVVGGPRDGVAHAAALEATLAGMEASPERCVLLASRMHGMSTNYGHLDLLLGRNVRRDIFPHLLRWLDRHAGVDLPDDRPSAPGKERSIDPGTTAAELDEGEEHTDPDAKALEELALARVMGKKKVKAEQAEPGDKPAEVKPANKAPAKPLKEPQQQRPKPEPSTDADDDDDDDLGFEDEPSPYIPPRIGSD